MSQLDDDANRMYDEDVNFTDDDLENHVWEEVESSSDYDFDARDDEYDPEYEDTDKWDNEDYEGIDPLGV